jgi:hypothetical protein
MIVRAGTRWRRRAGALLGPALVVAVACGALGALASSAAARDEGEEPVSILLPPWNGIWLNAGFTPKQDSAGMPSPGTMIADIDLTAAYEGARPPGIHGVTLDFDRDITFELGDGPTCRRSLLLAKRPATACADAIVGAGTYDTLLEKAETYARRVPGKLTVYDGGEHGGHLDLFLLLARRPAQPRPLVLTLKLHPGAAEDHRYMGTRGYVRVPPLERYENLVGLSFRLPVGLRCPRGELRVQARVRLLDRESIEEEAIRACTARSVASPKAGAPGQ